MTQFLLIALVIMAVALGATVMYFFSRARDAETAGSLLATERTELKQRDREITAIRARIEEIYERQQMGTQTQHAIIHQQIEQLQQHLQARARQIEGLQGELRHEMQQRELEMNELRAQLKEASTHLKQQVAQVQRAALPEASPRAEAPSSPREPVHVAPEPPKPERPAEHDDLSTLFQDQGRVGKADATEQAARLPQTEYPAPSAQRQAAGPAADAHPAQPPDQVRKVDAPAESYDESPEPADDELGDLVQWTFLDSDTLAKDTPSQSGGTAVEPPSHLLDRDVAGGDGITNRRGTSTGLPPPADSEDLTVLPMIDQERQALLYSAGVRTIAEIARFNRSDARDLVNLMPDIDEDEIINEWVFTAQSVLFERYQAELRSRRTSAV